MDSIESFISIGKHITKNPAIIGKIWTDFEKACENRKVILYGISEMVNFLWMRCNIDVKIIAAIDNNIDKQNRILSEFFDVSDLKDAQNIKTASKDILGKYNPNEVVILIASARYYDEIAKELDAQNFHCYFSILNLEYYYREYMQQRNISFETEEDYLMNYAKECAEKYPIQTNKIVFYVRTHISHEKYITEQLLSMDKVFDIVWIVNKITVNPPAGVRTVNEGNWKQFIYEMETAKIWFFGVPNAINLVKRKEQIYIQTKHWGSITLKKFYLDAPLMWSVGNNKQNWQLNGNLIDYIISGSEFDENSCRRGFGFNGKFLRFGSPRSDVMFSPNKYKKKIYEQFNLKSSDHALLYAPTYRFLDGKGDNYALAWQGLNFELLVDSLKQRWGGDWKILLRIHPVIKIRSKEIEKFDYVINVSDYGDSQELVAATDIMISDYSSIMFEPAYVQKPVFLYAPDKVEYQKKDFELLINYDTLPFPISTTNEELAEQIKNFDENKYKETVKAFLNKYGVHEDGHASERVANFVAKMIY